MISTTGGIFPRWSGDGNRLFYLTLSGDLNVVDVRTSASFQQNGVPRRLFGGVLPVPYGVAPAGDRFLFTEVPGGTGPPPPFTMVQNWLAALER
jgi:hypothetical protein